MSYELKWEERGYYLRMWGTITTRDMDDALAEIWGNSNSDLMKYCIRDYLDVTDIAIKMPKDEISFYVSTYEKLATNSRHCPLGLIAFLSANKDMDQIIDSYTQAMKEHSPSTHFKKFDDVNAAREWISKSLEQAK